ncbi:two-component system, chemotaxis family, sensor kinase CheA [Belnapia rosea]|nr:two-component system, chemotaxis family, sensor kinase CheA [Belnapia rosea]
MNEFVEQFLLEARELVEQATDDLLALEEKPGDSERLDSAFRAFHTLKGAAGIVDFAAMTRAMHAAEDVLSAIRTGANPVTPRLIGDCLTCLDQVIQWLDAMQVSGGELPPDAEAGADAILRRFGEESRVGGPVALLALPQQAPVSWVEAMLDGHPEAAAEASTAIRYSPDPGCFFRGEDPLGLIAQLPGIVALDLLPVAPWPELDALDPFACHLVLMVLISGSAEQAATLLHQVLDQVEIRPLRVATGGVEGDPGLSAAARKLLEAQLLLLAEDVAEGAAGRLVSAGKVAANVLRHGGKMAEAERLERHLSHSQTAGDPRILATAIEAALNGRLLAGAPDDVGPAPRLPEETAARALRVDVERVDALVTLTGELTIAKNAISHMAGLAQDGMDPKALAALLKQHHVQLDRLVDELQQSVLRIRVLPLNHVFRRFPRLVRDMAASLGRPARLVTEGEATEADKAIVEALFEPLLHVLRNAISHGIETASERAALGKPPVATVHLRATRDGEHVIIEVADDGRGIDLERIREVAMERGVAQAETLAAMTEAEVMDLIFAPGFSTATAVTGLSGRGVGMDAVRMAVDRLGGRVGIESRPGEGTLVRFTLPLTLMMTAVMTVEAGGQLFGIPLDAVVQTVSVPHDRILPVGASHAFVLRDRTIPLLELAEVLGQGRTMTPAAEAKVVVAAVRGGLGGLEVDRLGERMNVMLRPLDGLLTSLWGVAGTTLLGDGRVLIVLDLEEIFR